MLKKVKKILTAEWAKPAWAQKLETAGAAAGLILFGMTIGGYLWTWASGNIGSILAVLTRQVAVPLGLVLVAPVFLMMVPAFLLRRRYVKALDSASPTPSPNDSTIRGGGFAYDKTVVAAHEPHIVTSVEPSTAILINTGVIDASRGTVGLWTFVDQSDRGIRDLENNRYLFAQAGNRGKMKNFGTTRAYINVFALSCSPVSKGSDDRMWRLFIANAKGDQVMFKVDDTLTAPEWHHFVVRWDHSQPCLEFLIDGNVVESSVDYKSCWPESQGALTFGTWQTRGRIHFIESKVWRISMSGSYFDDGEIGEELRFGSLRQ